MTHTGLFAVVIGMLVALGGGLTPWVPLSVAVFGVLLAADRLGDWLLAAGGLALVYGLLSHGWAWMLEQAAGLSWATGIAAGLGCLVHTCGDMVTESGAPLLFPVPIGGETYWELRPPQWARFSTGKAFETRVVFPACVVAAVLLVPGVGDWVYDTVGAFR